MFLNLKGMFMELKKWLTGYCPWKGPRFNSQNPHGSSQPYVTPIPGDPLSLPGLWIPQIHVGHVNICQQNTYLHKVNTKSPNEKACAESEGVLHSQRTAL